MITVGEKAKIQIHWKVNPYDFSKEKENVLKHKVSAKYGVSTNQVKIIPDFIMLNENGNKISLTNDVIANIQNQDFQLKLFKEYLTVNEIKEYDFDLIKSIDAEINSQIDYDVYDKYRRYSIKWVKWQNFLSYGDSNYFDFSNLKGLVLLNGEPANQSGKTTFAIDLLHFLLFGKTEKSGTQDKIFNKHIPEASEVIVEGCLNIEGTDYIIKRTLKRPSLSKRSSRSKTVQKVEYYKIIGDTREELEEYDAENYQAENSIQTNKVIKEAIGNEADFDMIICATSSNLDELIEKKEAERGKLLSRWIGLLPIEQKDILAREKFNSTVKPYLVSNRTNSEILQRDIDVLNANIKSLKDENIKYSNINDQLDKDIKGLEDNKSALLSAKSNIDESLLKVDITTLSRRIETLIAEGKNKADELKDTENQINTLGETNYSANEYDELTNKIAKLNMEIGESRALYKSTVATMELLQKSEYCPTCGRKYDNVDNSDKILEHKNKLAEITSEGLLLNKELTELNNRLEKVKEERVKFENLSKLSVKKSILEAKISQLRGEYKEQITLRNEYNKNNEAIDKNNKLDIEVRNIAVSLENKRNTKETNIRYIEKNNQTIATYTEYIEEKTAMIKQIIEETKLVRNWRIYLDMIGRNGISKMVLRKTLPIINAQISQLLSDVCDFTVEISITDKNDIMFYLVKDGVYSDLTSGSGFEKTASALALRIVLGNISTLPRMNSLILDEIMGRVAKENLENMHTLLNKVSEQYQYVMQISHLDDIKDWSTEVITVVKESNVSRISRSRVDKK